jgi:phycobilisome rod-core linker protein
MAVPLQVYPLTTQNARVSNLAGDTSTVRTGADGFF